MYTQLFSKSGLSLDRLRRFLSVIEQGGVTKAAGGSPTLQSQISRQVGELESFFEVKLFRKEGKKLHLTQEGKRLEVIARELLNSLEQFMLDCSNQPKAVSIGAGEALIQWLLIRRLNDIKLDSTVIRMENLRSLEIISRIEDMRLDFGLVRTDAIPPHFQQIELGIMRYSLFVPRGLMKMHSRVGWKLVLRKIPLATIGSDGQFNQQLHNAAKDASINLNIALECSSFPQAAKALQSGDYGAILPSIARVDLPDEQFASISVPFLDSEIRKISLTWHSRMIKLRPDCDVIRRQLAQALLI